MCRKGDVAEEFSPPFALLDDSGPRCIEAVAFLEHLQCLLHVVRLFDEPPVAP